jgi:hypothetical protein
MLLDYITEIKSDSLGVARERLDEFGRAGRLSSAELQEQRKLERVVELASIPVADIDLYSIMSMRRPDGMPKWSLVNPNTEIGRQNGAAWKRGWWRRKSSPFTEFAVRAGTRIGQYDNAIWDVIDIASKNLMRVGHMDHMGSVVSVPSGGFPVLPLRIRSLINMCAKCDTVAVLYQPTAWGEPIVSRPDPDPALLVRKTENHPYQVLAVWGHDGPQIKEFSV